VNGKRDTRQVIVAVDAMGGDHAPGEIVAGAVLAEAANIATPVLVGDEAVLRPLLARHRGTSITIVHAPEAVAMDAPPSQALRGAERTSLGAAIDLVRDGKAEAVVSAGNSGAFLAIALFRLRTITGIARPAIAVVMPGSAGPVVLLDCGANVDCRPEWIAQFGVMGSAYARGVLGVEDPRVGIVSVGEERSKGNAQAIEAAQLLEAAPVRFIGNVEGKDLLSSVADVVVTDGFIGNVMLKLAEGTSMRIADIAREEVDRATPIGKLGALLMRPVFRGIREKILYEEYGGAPLLGIQGSCIVAHGRAKSDAIKNAIRLAAAEAGADVVGRIAELMATRDASVVSSAGRPA
jgi:glycerol-3-phosphate acyltransferase PlsX